MGTSLADAYVQIIPSAKGISGALNNVLGGEASVAGGKAGNTIASKIKGIIATAGIGEALRQTLLNGADLQQSIGGIETLFKDSSNIVIQNAKKAYETAGMSANAYMETVTGFSASLLQSLGGDTKLAAEIADMALVDMADNANKMGTSMESIQYAYQGFAKQNYTMLDNLKLGYGGTKEEMERLLAKASELDGVTYDISSLSDVYTAIHTIQEDLGIMNATADEASTTFSGSFSAMKAAAENILGNMALGEKIDLEPLAQTAETFVFDNFLPMLGNIVTSLPDIAAGIVTQFPLFLERGGELLSSLVSGIVESIPEKLPEALAFIQQLGDDIAAKAPEFIEKGFQLLSELVDGIISAIPILIENVPQIISTFANIINDNAPTVIMKGVELLGKLVGGILSAIPTLVANIPKIISAIVDTIQAFNWMNIGKNIMSALKEGIKNMGPVIKNAVNNIKNGIFDTLNKLPGKVLSIGKDIISGIWKGLSAKWNWLLDKVSDLANSIFEAACEALDINSPSRKFEWIAEMSAEGEVRGVKKKTPKVVEAVKSQQNAIVRAAEESVNSGFYDKTQSLTNRIARIIVPVQLDGREIARAIAEYTSEQLVWEV